MPMLQNASTSTSLPQQETGVNNITLFGPPGSTITGQYAWPLYSQLTPDTTVVVRQVDFNAARGLNPDAVLNLINGYYDYFQNGGEFPVLFVLYEAVEEEAQAPVMLCFPGTDMCVPNPFAGIQHNIGSYRMYLVTVEGSEVPVQPAQLLQYRAQFTAPTSFGGYAGLGLSLVLLAIGIVIIKDSLAGTNSLRQVTEGLAPINPGNIPSQAIGATTMPLIAVAVALIAAGIFLPHLATQVQAGVNTGPVSVSGSAGGGGGGGRR